MITSKNPYAGPNVKRVQVLQIDHDRKVALVSEPGAPKGMMVPLRIRRSRDSGGMPKVGETWLIDRSIGSTWTFAAIVTEYLPSPDAEADQYTAIFFLMGC